MKKVYTKDLKGKNLQPNVKLLMPGWYDIYVKYNVILVNKFCLHMLSY